MSPFENLPLVAAITATALAQVLKVILVLLTERRWAFDRMLETGGMPSSHSATVTALAVTVGLVEGFGSTLFALSVVFAGIVMYDATGIRRAAGMHAQLINDLVQELAHLFDEGFQPTALKTLLGHTYPQVLVGSILGGLTGLVVGL
ncbi:MAG: divergent PAP2 family protein [Nocardiopsis sp. BM-2018]|nr:MAG: divergent PAP2 family protein [Nocardiopsis sp. BM-2018]